MIILIKFFNIIFLLFVFIFDLPKIYASKKNKYSFKFNTICIDIGHGGKDPGCLSYNKKFKEKDIAFRFSKILKSKLETAIPRIKILMTRKKDIFVPLNKRAIIANKNKSDLFITIHCNSCKNKNAKGCEIYIMGPFAKLKSGVIADLKKKNIQQFNKNTASFENQVIFFEKNYKKKYIKNLQAPHSKILTNLCADANRRNSIVLSHILKGNISKNTKLNPVRIKEDGFILLWSVVAPSIYLELGFISNARDLQILTSQNDLDKLATSVVKSIKEYINFIENN